MTICGRGVCGEGRGGGRNEKFVHCMLCVHESVEYLHVHLCVCVCYKCMHVFVYIDHEYVYMI